MLIQLPMMKVGTYNCQQTNAYINYAIEVYPTSISVELGMNCAAELATTIFAECCVS